ncbi:glutathione S-transferase [Geopyxis carbonaria]|nr:glutathione S-transferase [Geopyxis carbonaria]
MSSNVFASIYAPAGDPRLRKAIAAAALNGLAIDLPHFPMRPGIKAEDDPRDATFWSRFPLGKFPALVTPSGFTVVETAAIASYIADSGPRREQLLGKDNDPEGRAKIAQWEAHSSSEFNSPIRDGYMTKLGFKEFSKEADDKSRNELERLLKYLDLTLENNKWVAGSDDLTLADLSLASVLCVGWGGMWIGKDGVAGWGSHPKTVEWLDRVIAYEGIGGAFDTFKYHE